MSLSSQYNDLKTIQKVSLLVILMLIFIIIVGFTGYFFATKNANAMEEMYNDSLVPITQLTTIASNLNQFQADLLEMSTSDNKNTAIKLAKSDKQLIEQTDKLVSVYAATKLEPYETENLPKLQNLIKEIKPVIADISQQ